MKIHTCLLLLFCSILNLWAQENNSSETKSLQINSSLIVDNVYNFNGGIQNGLSTLGLFDFNIEYKPTHKGIFRNTSMYAHLLKTAGKGPSEHYIADVQVASNIEGKASRFIYELVVKQQFGDFNLSLGLHDLNTEFMTSEYAGNYINSSFGIYPVISLNVPVSIFPVTSMGGIISYNKKKIDLVAGIYNLNHEYIEEEEFNIDNHLYKKGFLGVAELRYKLYTNNDLSGEYKIGGYFKDCHHEDEILELADCTTEKNYGLYFIGDQVLWSTPRDFQLGLFTQLGFAPKETNYVPDYYGIGVSIKTSDKKYFPEFIGLAIASVGLNNYNEEHIIQETPRETAIELSAKKELFGRITIQPDLQYIINPSGIYDNTFVGILRLQIDFNN
jgi:porin